MTLTMEIFDGSVRYYIKFTVEDSHFFPFISKMDRYQEFTSRTTCCEIYTGTKDNEILISKAYSSAKKDEFSYLVGKVLSFYRALENLGLFNYGISDHEMVLLKTLTEAFSDKYNIRKARDICKSRGFDLSDYLPTRKRSPSSNVRYITTQQIKYA